MKYLVVIEAAEKYYSACAPGLPGGGFPPGGFLTNDPTASSEEARQRLALPNVAPDQQLFLYTLTVNLEDVTPPRPVAPMPSNVTRELLPGDGTEFIAVRPIAVTQATGGPVLAVGD